MRSPIRDRTSEKYAGNPNYVWVNGTWRLVATLEKTRETQRRYDRSSKGRARDIRRNDTIERYLYFRKRNQRSYIAAWQSKLEEAANGNP